MRLPAVIRVGGPVDGRAREWMTKRDCAVERDQPGRLGRLGCARGDPKTLGGAPKERGVADRLGRREEQQTLGVSRER